MDKILAILDISANLELRGLCAFLCLFWCLPLLLHLMTSDLSTNPTALPIQLWAVRNICLTLLPHTGCCDTSTVKGRGDFWILQHFTFCLGSYTKNF